MSTERKEVELSLLTDKNHISDKIQRIMETVENHKNLIKYRF